MKTRQINLRLEADLLAALERVAREESLERGTVIRRLLEEAIRRWEVGRALRLYQRGELSLGRAAEEAGLTQWEIVNAVRAAGVAYPLEREDVAARLAALPNGGGPGGGRGFGTRIEWLGREVETLADVPPQPGGVLLVGINPAPVSVAAGHYYQGRIGKRLWQRLERLGLLDDPRAGAEDEAFARAGHGLTDLVKRPTASAGELGESELRAGIDELRAKVREWQPGLVLFAFKEAARRLFGASVRPGAGLPLEGAPTFLLSGPYASRGETERNDAELARLLGEAPRRHARDMDRSQRVTTKDLEAGRIRFPRSAKRFFPPERTDVQFVLRGTAGRARYDPRTGPDKERSAVLVVGSALLKSLVDEDEVLRVSRGLGGIVQLD